MEYLKKTAEGIAKNALRAIDEITEEEVNEMIDIILGSYTIFVIGSGRADLVGKAFAMRLMHLGFNVYVVGEVITPAITSNDCLVAISGSGENNHVIMASKISKEINAKVIGITSEGSESSLFQLSDVGILIQGENRTPWKYYTSHVLKGNYGDLTPMGTLFETSTSIFLDGLIAEFMVRLGKKETDLKKRHAIIE